MYLFPDYCLSEHKKTQGEPAADKNKRHTECPGYFVHIGAWFFMLGGSRTSAVRLDSCCIIPYRPHVGKDEKTDSGSCVGRMVTIQASLHKRRIVFSMASNAVALRRYSTRPLEGRVHVTLRAAIPIRFAVRNTLCECVRAIQLGFFAEKPRKTPRVSGGSVQISN